jgi:ADP-heptose:LPS heptosyltransferase
MHLNQFAPLAELKSTDFYSLQKGPAANQIAAAPRGLDIIDLSADLRDFIETAALIANLDLIISVDTSVAHLASALGKPVWLLLPHAPDWRWMLHRSDSPWYPTMRLFRQPTPGNWTTVIKNITNALAENHE